MGTGRRDKRERDQETCPAQGEGDWLQRTWVSPPQGQAGVDCACASAAPPIETENLVGFAPFKSVTFYILECL
jgi:hypothetical protein